jgi:hypothetical protein
MKLNSINMAAEYAPIESKDYKTKTSEYVLWGKNHIFPSVLLGGLEKSITHKQITMSIAEQVFGK